MNNSPTTGRRVAPRFFVQNQVQIVHILAVIQGKKKKNEDMLKISGDKFRIKKNKIFRDIIKHIMISFGRKNLKINLNTSSYEN